MGRPLKKPEYSSANNDNELLESVANAYMEKIEQHGGQQMISDSDTNKYISDIANNYGVSPLKMRKLLITVGIYSTSTSRLVVKLYSEGKTVKEIQEITGLKKSSINGYLPYQKVIYNQREKSVGADRVGLYRKRWKCIEKLHEDLSEESLWDCFVAFQSVFFHTASGLPFKYTIKVGRTGEYTKELLVDRRQESKPLAWNSVALAFKNAIVYEGIVPKPKALGDIRGISYIYPVFYRFGLIQVPEKVKVKIIGNNPKIK